MANTTFLYDYYKVEKIVTRNTDTASDINQSTITDIPIAGDVVSGYNSNLFTPLSDTQIRCNFSGNVTVYASVFFTSSKNNTLVMLRILKNGVPTGARGASGHTHKPSGHNHKPSGAAESTSLVQETFSVVSNDIVSVGGIREGSNGVAVMSEAGSSILMIEREPPNA